MELNEFSLFATYDQCKIISEKYPDIKTVFCWYKYRNGKFGGGNFEIGNSIHYGVGIKSAMELGANIFALRHVDEIIPAYTYQELIQSETFRYWLNEDRYLPTNVYALADYIISQ